MELSGNIKNSGFNSEFNFQNTSSSNRALEAYNEFKKLKGDEYDCDSENDFVFK